MKIEKIKGKNPVAEFFAAPLSVEGEADLHHLQFADALAEMMKEQGISKVELARRMGIQPSRVTAMLSANGNFTIQTMVRAARAVNAKLHHKLAPASHSVRWYCWQDSDVHPAFQATATVRKPAAVSFKLPDYTPHEESTAAA
jgi:DNA-binding phage protein